MCVFAPEVVADDTSSVILVACALPIWHGISFWAAMAWDGYLWMVSFSFSAL